VDFRALVAHLDEYLRGAEVPDHPAALNGLQVASDRAEVRRVALAVDASARSIDSAVAARADLLVVHHGLFWGGNQPVTGRRFRRLKAALDGGMGVYAAHLPLDVHPEVGNNAVLARALGLEITGSFGEFRGWPLGVMGELDLEREALGERLRRLLGSPVRLVPGGPERIRRVGVITGGAGGEIEAAVRAELDAFVTGEGSHHHYFDAEEGGVNLYLAGHYATETWGVRALGAQLEERFGLETVFLDHPTGL
jgi:dinuclear metal center YbgI/SA1388 family protein